MGEARTKEGARQIAMVCLDELVPVDDRYRRIDAIVGDWGFVREAARPYYVEGVGRPSVDPTVLLKLMLAGGLEGIGSMRELLRVADLRLDLRLFLGYGLASGCLRIKRSRRRKRNASPTARCSSGCSCTRSRCATSGG